jgi:hypothetical protein
MLGGGEFERSSPSVRKEENMKRPFFNVWHGSWSLLRIVCFLKGHAQFNSLGENWYHDGSGDEVWKCPRCNSEGVLFREVYLERKIPA